MRNGLWSFSAALACACTNLGSNDAGLIPGDAVAGSPDTSGVTEEDVSGGGADVAPAGGAPTWHGEVRGIMARHCASCHVEGGPAPFDASDYAATLPWSRSIVLDLEAGVMPPFLASTEDCRHYLGENVVSAADKATVAAWEAAGSPEGDPSDYVAPALPEPVDPGPPDFALRTDSPYTPTDPSGDDLRCILVGDVFDEDTDIERLVVVPDKTAIVHHVIVFEVSGAAADTLDAMDAAEPGTGYRCTSGPGVPARNIGGWVPGGGLGLMPADTAIRIPKGSRLVLQMHYNTLFAPAEADASTLEMWRTKTTPKYLLDIQARAHPGLLVPAGDADSVQEKSFPTIKEARVVGVLAHMHKLGKAMKVTVEGGDACVIDIPRWDFDWQQSYLFRTEEPLILKPGDTLHMACTFDNSAANQPLIDGVQVEPIDVRWGEGTRDEMCLHYLMVQLPYTPPAGAGGGDCPGFETCFEDCVGGGHGVSRCVVQCSGTKVCRDCLISGLLGCLGQEGCAAEVGGLQACTKDIPLSKVVLECGTELKALDKCGAPKIAACNGTCGVTLESL